MSFFGTPGVVLAYVFSIVSALMCIIISIRIMKINVKSMENKCKKHEK